MDAPWHVCGLLLVLLLAVLHWRSRRSGALIMILWRLPSTILHELSHFVVAFVTGGRPSSFSILPRAEHIAGADGSSRRIWILGSVQARLGIFSAVPTVLSPLLYLPAAFFLYRHWFTWYPATGQSILLLYLILFLLLSSSLPSSGDLALLFSNPCSLLFYLSLGIALFVWRDQAAETIHLVENIALRYSRIANTI